MNITSPSQRFGPLRVTITEEALRTFRRESGWREEKGAVPLSFPVVWMKIPEISDAVRTVTENVGVPVHEAQQFEYSRRLQLNETYNLNVEIRLEPNPERLIATAQIVSLDGSEIGRVTSTLRLIALN